MIVSQDPKASLRNAALHFHEHPKPGKLEITPSKPLANARDLALAYSPGVAAPCEEIAADPEKAYSYTSKGNLVAVISNGTAVLGLGNIGALASKPVMEGKAVLFKKFAGIDSMHRLSRVSVASIWRTSRLPIASTSKRTCELA